jgi:histidyl-tRNA synthetase
MATKEAVTRWWSLGPVFRYEAVNTGRYRQFYQIDCEAYGVGEPTLDAELIACCTRCTCGSASRR